MAAASDQRALASTLTDRGDAEFAQLFAVRGVSPTATWRDLYDAAEALLEPTAVGRALDALPAAAAYALTTAVTTGTPVAESARADLAARALATADGEVFQAVGDAVRERLPITDPPIAARPASTPDDDAAAAERAFTSAASLADVLLLCLEAPLGRIGSGTLGAVDRRRLVEAGAIAHAEDADPLIEVAEAGGLLVGRERTWLVTRSAREWLHATTAVRWETLALRLRDALPEGLRSPGGGWISAAEWPSAYPFLRSWPASAEQWRRRWVAWGLFTPVGAEPTWVTPLARGEGVDADVWAKMLPTEVDRLYLQNDLTAIAPGPLAPELDVRLRTMANRESRAQATSYRFTASTIGAAITAGETAESLREFLESVSLTGLPQPLAYVIESTAARHGQIRVGRDDDAGLTRVTSDDPAAIATIAVDQALRSLGLQRETDDLISRVPVDSVYWALADARYPVIAVDGAGSTRTLDRSRIAEDPIAEPATQKYAALLARLRSGGSDGDAAWLERELDQAVRARAVVDVVVSLPDGSTRTFRLEATGLGGGRLRGRDRGADVERTLPLRSIVSVHPVL
ncbi:helicase-associated domain-containing protein [Microbacterium sp. P06]|uniref:helicase-associated domain-containing protein n=1 Tax=Microbacterium sp. P06 TaxID=3366949 RepID=UPI003745921E